MKYSTIIEYIASHMTIFSTILELVEFYVVYFSLIQYNLNRKKTLHSISAYTSIEPSIVP
jgi:hypothetical protein